VEPNREQLIELARLHDPGELRVAIYSTLALSDAAAAFERGPAWGKRGKVVIWVAAARPSVAAEGADDAQRADATPRTRTWLSTPGRRSIHT
jgi:hypothetical protein